MKESLTFKSHAFQQNENTQKIDERKMGTCAQLAVCMYIIFNVLWLRPCWRTTLSEQIAPRDYFYRSNLVSVVNCCYLQWASYFFSSNGTQYTNSLYICINTHTQLHVHTYIHTHAYAQAYTHTYTKWSTEIAVGCIPNLKKERTTKRKGWCQI